MSEEEREAARQAWMHDGEDLTFGGLHGRRLLSDGPQLPNPHIKVLQFQFR
jgi:hypothetical protein